MDDNDARNGAGNDGNSDGTRDDNAAAPQAARWVMVLFGLPFAAAGIALFAFLVVPPLLDWRAAQSWVAVEAELLHAGLQTHSDSDGGETWEATARYRYEYAASRWENDRVALNRGADNIGSFQQDLAARLGMAFVAGDPVTVYVNPRDPREAIINRELRPGLMLLMGLFSLVFALVGLGIIAAGMMSPRRRHAAVYASGPATASATSASTPSTPQPWRTREEWSSPTIVSDPKHGARGAWIFALVWCALSLPATTVIPEELAKGNWPILLILLFDVIGIGLLAWAVRASWSSRKFGAVALTLDPHPGAVGGDVAGYIDIPVAHDPARAFHVSLGCTRSWVSGSGKNRSTRHESKWQDEKWLHAEPLDAERVRLWFRFEPPAGLPVSEEPSDDYHHWTLHLAADLPGLDLARHYEIPVFATGARSHGATAARVQVSLTRDLAAVEARTGFRQVPGGAAMHFRAGRNRVAALVAIFIVGGIFGGVGVGVLLSDADVVARLVIGVVFSAIGAIGLLSGIWSLGNSLQVEADDVGARVQRWLFGVPLGQQAFARADIEGIGIVRGSTTTVGTRTTVHYDLVLKTRDGILHGIGDGFRGATQATMAADTFARYTRLPFLGELDRSEAFAARKAAYLASRGRH